MVGSEQPVDEELENAKRELADVRRKLVEKDRRIEALQSENARLRRESDDRLAERERAYSDLETLDQLKSDFLALISHELRTPLTTMMGYTDLVLRGVGGPLTPKQSHHLKTALVSARELLALINSLIEFSILEAGRGDNRPSKVILTNALESALAPLRPVAVERGVALKNEVRRPLPPVKADEPKLSRAIESVLSNAIKFTPAGGSVTLSAFTIGDHAVICIEDTGIGMSSDEMDRIWEKFYQVDSSPSRKYGGVGLGLAMAKKLLEMQDGHISAESEGPDRGTIFRIELPLWEDRTTNAEH